MSTGRAIVWCIVAAFVALGGAAYYLSRDGMSARARLSPPVDYILDRVMMEAVSANARPDTNPLNVAETWRDGGREFQQDCAVCHGADGRGEGMIGQRQYPPATNLASDDTQEMSDGELYQVIANGIRLTGMPAWGEGADPQALWRFVSYIRHLPQLTPDDVRQLKSEAEADQAARSGS